MGSKDAGAKAFLILDDFIVQRAKLITEWLTAKCETIEMS